MNEEAPRSQRVVVDGHGLETVCYPGDPARAPIVLLHEGLGSVTMWRDFPLRLRARTARTVVAYSRWGYGASDPLTAPRPLSYMHHEGEVVLPALLRALQIEAPILFGHSDGASIALIAAGAHPNVCSALILEAPHVFVEDLSVQSIERARAAFATTDLPQKLARYHDDAAGAFRGWNDAWLDPDFRAWNIEAYADDVTCPVLLLQGERDEYGSLDQLTRIARRIAHAQKLVLPNSAHSPHRDAVDVVLDSVAAFCDLVRR